MLKRLVEDPFLSKRGHQPCLLHEQAYPTFRSKSQNPKHSAIFCQFSKVANPGYDVQDQHKQKELHYLRQILLLRGTEHTSYQHETQGS